MLAETDASSLIAQETEFESVGSFERTVLHNDFGILLINVRSIRQNKLSLELFLSLFKNKLKLIVCTEVWLTSFAGRFVDIEGYEVCSNGSEINRADGVLIYVDISIRHEFVAAGWG